MRKALGLVAVVALFSCACRASPKPPPFKAVADVKQLMQTVVDPAADVIWGAVGSISSAEGMLEIAPKNDEEWALVRNSAYVLTESGNLLMMGNRPKDEGEWLRHCQELIDVGTRAIKAAEAKDKDAIFEVGGDIYGVCSSCHQTYLVKVLEAESGR